MRLSSCGPLEVAMIGLGTVESIPVYHYSPGGLAVRLRLPSYAYDIFDCPPEEHDICIFSREGLLEPEPLEPDRLARVVLGMRPDIVLVETPRLLGSEGCLLEALRGGVAVGLRVLASEASPALDLEPDLIVADYPLDYLVDPGLSTDMVLGIRRLARSGVPLEVNVYVERADPARLAPVAEALAGTSSALHVHVKLHEGGGPIRKAYELLRRRVKHVYIHNNPYSYEDTLCPSCGATVAIRRGGVLERLEAPGGRCWKCASIIPFYGRIKERTPRPVIVATGGQRWLHPRLVVARRSSSPSRT
ncbi:MAG: hypothetical protein F7C34_01535 [Desulfurococcales archaeon]|nr:hypothetical protein [Desulfurococcales archaeon]